MKIIQMLFGSSYPEINKIKDLISMLDSSENTDQSEKPLTDSFDYEVYQGRSAEFYNCRNGSGKGIVLESIP